ncbi:FbpB family small basic protein [Bacillus taeanensis]|uniref:FbpB family small basic protein n=1 Tax=Bacillus taeanensis TaxID=273032 RepID=A0A366XXH2_9BACI|nr:FbpB family small basic protein [Bacillus taeanensis]RBW71090.1 FbpB family small basic protein [Bacillus taeanensis]
MRRIKKITFNELVIQNKQELLRNPEAIARIEQKIDEKHANNF